MGGFLAVFSKKYGLKCEIAARNKDRAGGFFAVKWHDS
jgi:hypothetical protein